MQLPLCDMQTYKTGYYHEPISDILELKSLCLAPHKTSEEIMQSEHV